MKEKHTYKRGIYWLLTILIPALAVVVVMSTYGYVKKQAQKNYENPLETAEYIDTLFTSNYVLYKSLYEKLSGESIRYVDLYYSDMESILGEEYKYFAGNGNEGLKELESDIETNFTNGAENRFSSYSEMFDYYIEDLNGQVSITNTETDIKKYVDDYVFWITIEYDEKGNANISYIKSENSEKVMKYATNEVLIKNEVLKEFFATCDSVNYYSLGEDIIHRSQKFATGPINCRIIYGVSEEAWQQYMDADINTYHFLGLYATVYKNYMATDVTAYVMWTFFAVILTAIILPLGKFRKNSFSVGIWGRIPLEVLACILLCVMSCASEIRIAIVYLLEGHTANIINTWAGFPDKSIGVMLAYVGHVLQLYSIFLASWLCGLCLRVCREKGLKEYLKENWLIYRFLAFCKKRIVNGFHALERINVTKNIKKTILKIVLINAVVLLFISSIWFVGWGFVVVYSILLYFVIKLYVSRLQDKYNLLLAKMEDVASGNLHVDMTDDLGIFNPMKEKLSLVQSGFRHAVEKEVQSERMKTELITNVSHDLKTPLTAIITYVDLLKEESLSDEKRKEYIDTLDNKSQRLKVLIEDLFEVSKANSGNVTLHMVDVDICNLIKQVRVELADKLEIANLDVRMELPDKKVMVSLDSQKAYRIYENLFLNISKYALHGTRVYVQGTLTDGEISISLKNISAQEIKVQASDLTERFVRGDESRNTDGSGLGLAIAKSFVELQGGKFVLESDGDLFKVTTVFPVVKV